MLRLELGQG